MTKRRRGKKKREKNECDRYSIVLTNGEGRDGGERACTPDRRKASLTLQLFAAAHPFYRGLVDPSEFPPRESRLCASPIRARFAGVVRAAIPRSSCMQGARRIDERMNGWFGREFHTKHNPHIETQTQWPRQVGRGAVLPARTRVRELHPRVRAYVYQVLTYRDVRMEREREKERRKEMGHVHMCTHVRAERTYLCYYVN